MAIIKTSLKRKEFINIASPDHLYHGGNQAWYRNNPIGIQGGCGPTAAANMLAYLGIQNPALREIYTYKKEMITTDDFIGYMNDVYQYVTPIKVPQLIAGKKIGKGKFPVTLGVPTIGKFKRGAKKFSNTKGIKLHAISFSQFPTLKNAKKYIKEALEKDYPVALKNFINPKLSSIEFTDANGAKSKQNFQLHWVTITSMIENTETGMIMIEVSSWGGTAKLNLRDVIGSLGFGGMVYFKGK